MWRPKRGADPLVSATGTSPVAGSFSFLHEDPERRAYAMSHPFNDDDQESSGYTDEKNAAIRQTLNLDAPQS